MAAHCQLLPDDSSMCLNQSGVGPGTRVPIRLTELPGASRVAGLLVARAGSQPMDNRPQRRPTCQELPVSVPCNSLPLRSNHSLDPKSTISSQVKAYGR